MKIQEGYVPFGEWKTYYRIVGKKSLDKAPILLLHGGPGSTHNYFEVLDSISNSGRQVITYDQLGCGNSMVKGHPELWKSETWIDELKNLREQLGLTEIHLLGQSWGGMLAIEYMCDHKPDGIKSLILSSTLPSADLWEQEGRRNITYLPIEMQKAIKEAEESNDYSSQEYQSAEAEYMSRHAFNMPEELLPECLKRQVTKGRESYLMAWGQNEFTPSGTLKGWEYRDKLSNINVQTLIISGAADLCTPLIAKTMYDSIKNSKWELFQFSRHMPFVEEEDKYKQILTAWLNDSEK